MKEIPFIVVMEVHYLIKIFELYTVFLLRLQGAIHYQTVYR